MMVIKQHSVAPASPITVRYPPRSSSYSADAVVPPGDVTCSGEGNGDDDDVNDNDDSMMMMIMMMMGG
jgi:hypothetical protein